MMAQKSNFLIQIFTLVCDLEDRISKLECNTPYTNNVYMCAKIHEIICTSSGMMVQTSNTGFSSY